MIILILGIFGLLLILLFLYELFRRYKWVSWFTFLILPIVLLPWWIFHAEHSLFGWVKIYTIAFAGCWLMGLRFTSLKDKKWAYYVAFLILALNIIEASLQDIVTGSTSNYITAAAGLLLILTVPGIQAISVDEKSRYRDFSWDMPRAWIIGFTLWNTTFIYMFVTQDLGIHAAVLGAALIVGLINNERWAQARVFTLGSFLLLYWSYQPMFDLIRVPLTVNENVALASAVLSLSWVSVYALSQVRVWLRQRTEPSFPQQI